MINRILKNNPYRDKENFIKESIYASLELPINVREMLEGFKRYGNEMTWLKSESTLLELAERNGLMPKSHCRAGICGACRVDLDSGAVEQLVGEALSDDSVLLCCSVPTSNIEVSL